MSFFASNAAVLTDNVELLASSGSGSCWFIPCNGEKYLLSRLFSAENDHWMLRILIWITSNNLKFGELR